LRIPLNEGIRGEGRGDRGEREGDFLDNFIGSDSLIFWDSWWWTDRTALITDGSVPVFENCPTLIETRLMACNEEKGRKYLIKSRLLLTSLVNFPLTYLFRFVKLLTYLLLRGESNKNSQDMGCPCQLKANRWMLFQQSLSKPERWIPISGARFVHLKTKSREKLNYSNLSIRLRKVLCLISVMMRSPLVTCFKLGTIGKTLISRDALRWFHII